jgi:hypothetical protein
MALSLQVSGGDLYVSGWDGGGIGNGRVWMGPAGGAAPLAQILSLGNWWLNSVSVAGGDVYTGGARSPWNDGRVWKNSAQIHAYGATTGVQAICAVPAP